MYFVTRVTVVVIVWLYDLCFYSLKFGKEQGVHCVESFSSLTGRKCSHKA